jgi:signal transduction histidine kinase
LAREKLTGLFKFCCLLVLPLILCCHVAQAQDAAIENIPNQPAIEVYDLMKDSKGYLWLAHNLGVSRYDGTNFINFSNPRQNSFSMTDLIQDKMGRIWCHNFSGQIFYIENQQLHLLSQYKFEEERGYPRMVICGDELIATSSKGLFVYHLVTGRSRYLLFSYGTNSLACVGKKVIFFTYAGWYSYQADKPITRLAVDDRLPKDYDNFLQNVSFKDTFYLVANPTGTYYTLTLNNNNVIMHQKHETNAFINTISVDKDQVWVNTKSYSYTTHGNQKIEGMNISDIITDSEGHRWMSSLKKGLYVQYNNRLLNKFHESSFGKDDYVKKMLVHDKALYLGTVKGNLYKLDSDSLTKVAAIPQGAGAIERIAYLDDGKFLLGGSIGVYLFDHTTGIVTLLNPIFSLKDIVITKDKIYAASPHGVLEMEKKEVLQKKLPLTHIRFNRIGRCRSIALHNDTIFAAYSDGVFIYTKDTVQRLLYQGTPIYASEVQMLLNKVLIATYSQGILVVEGGKIKNLVKKDEMVSNIILDFKMAGTIPWIIYNDYFQPLNKALTSVKTNVYPFPKVIGIHDIDMYHNQMFVGTGEGVYLAKKTASHPAEYMITYIDEIVANGKDLITSDELKYSQNHLEFQVSTPFYSPNSNIIYQYRIKDGADTLWHIGSPGQFRFNAVGLKPGAYTFEVVAVDKSRNAISKPAFYNFRITPPWYQTWVFMISVGLAAFGIGFYIIRLYYRSRLQRQQAEYTKMLAIQAERQRISSEIHDDIGAGLSALRLMTELTRNKLPENDIQREVSKIHSSISDLSLKVREVIWSLNTDNDKLENLLFYIQRQAQSLFENSPISLKATLPHYDIPHIIIKGEKRRHIYLSVKEALHNCLKHSEAKNCELTMHIQQRVLHICIRDDGKGFLPAQEEHLGNGLPGMRKRMRQVGGHIEVQSAEKTEVHFIIPFN